MYINNINILYYVLVGIIGVLVGQVVNLCNEKMPKHIPNFTKNFIKEIKQVKPNYYIIIINSLLYIWILYYFGLNSIKTIQYLLLTPMILSAFYIDYKHQIIPNRLTLTIFEIGLIFVFIQGMTNINIAIDMLLGMFIGGGIFLILTLLGGLVFGKETMGFGDVKIIGALGLFFGWRSIILLSIISFFIGALFSIILLSVLKFQKKPKQEYIAFGPFIVIAAFIVMFVPFEILISIPFELFTFGRFNG